MPTKRMLTIMLALAAVPGAARAQVDWGGIMQTEAMNSAIDEAAHEGRGVRQGRSPAAGLTPSASLSQDLARGFVTQTGSSATPTTASVSGRYTPTAAVRQKLAQIMGDAAAKNGAAQGAEMRKLVLSGEALRVYEQVGPRIGLRANDAIDAFAFYMLAQWGVANDYREDFTRAQAAGVRRQAANAYAGVADQLKTDALRQEFAEMLAIQGAIMAGVHENAVRAGDDAAAHQYAQTARQGGRKVFTMDPTSFTLTDEGFRKAP